MAQILVRDLDVETIAILKAMAAENRRTLQAEVRFILEDRLSRDAARDRLWAVADEMQEGLKGTAQSDSTETIRADRDGGDTP